MLSGRGVCDELITRPEESYQLWCVVVCDLETSRIGAAYMYDISSLRVNDLNMLLLLTLPLISGYDPQFCLLFPLYNTLDMARWVTLWFTVTRLEAEERVEHRVYNTTCHNQHAI